MAKTKQTRTQRMPAIHSFFLENAGRSFSVRHIANELFPADFQANPESVTGSVSSTISRLMETDANFERLNRGIYRYNPDGKSEEDTAPSGPNMFEALTAVGDGMLIKGDDESVWVARRLDGNDLLAMLAPR